MKILIGADHNGFQYRDQLKAALEKAGHEVQLIGQPSLQPDDDYPAVAGQLATTLLNTNDPEAKGILICGSGQGVAMAANRFKGIRASVCWNKAEAQSARNDDDSNVLCLAARYLSLEEAGSIMATFLSTPFAGAPRFIRRIQQLDQLT